MPTVLQSEVRSLIEKIINDNAGESEHIPIDIYRTLRDESTLYFERQRLWDSIDSDPFDHFQKNDALLKQLERAKSLMNIVSYSKNTTPDGFCVIECTLELRKDDLMCNSVKQNVRLHFKYERIPINKSIENVKNRNETKYQSEKENNPIEDINIKKRKRIEESSNSSKKCKPNSDNRKRKGKGTNVVFSIELSRDFSSKQLLLISEVMAKDEAPSVDRAIPMIDENLYDDDQQKWNDKPCESDSKSCSIHGVTSDSSNELNYPNKTNNKDSADKYTAYLDPDELINFLTWTRLEMDEVSVIFYLLSHPFYENEWDIVGYILDTLFDDDGNDSDDDKDFNVDNSNDGKKMNEMKSNQFEKCKT